jgi:hypothetical protein
MISFLYILAAVVAFYVVFYSWRDSGFETFIFHVASAMGIAMLFVSISGIIWASVNLALDIAKHGDLLP